MGILTLILAVLACSDTLRSMYVWGSAESELPEWIRAGWRSSSLYNVCSAATPLCDIWAETVTAELLMMALSSVHFLFWKEISVTSRSTCAGHTMVSASSSVFQIFNSASTLTARTLKSSLVLKRPSLVPQFSSTRPEDASGECPTSLGCQGQTSLSLVCFFPWTLNYSGVIWKPEIISLWHLHVGRAW